MKLSHFENVATIGLFLAWLKGMKSLSSLTQRLFKLVAILVLQCSLVSAAGLSAANTKDQQVKTVNNKLKTRSLHDGVESVKVRNLRRAIEAFTDARVAANICLGAGYDESDEGELDCLRKTIKPLISVEKQMIGVRLKAKTSSKNLQEKHLDDIRLHEGNVLRTPVGDR